MMQRAKDVNEIVTNLAINSIALAGAGVFFLILGLLPDSPLGGPLIFVDVLLLLVGIFIGVAAIGFYMLQPWSYPLVSILVSSLKGDRKYFTKKLANPELRRAFGLSSNDSNQDQGEEQGSS